MDREKQIEEMATILTDGGCTKCNCDKNGKFNCLPMYSTGLLYNAGYRKQSEVVKEIFDDIKEKLIFNTYGIATISNKTFCELKKKYTGE